MIEGNHTIYVDEAGFTGNYLLDPDQPLLVYSSVALEEKLAVELRDEAFNKFRIQGEELKGASLVRSRKGRQAVSWLLERCADKSLLFIADKEYALACKFFEYVYEPVLAARNSLLYAINFHKFVAMVVYIHFRARTKSGEDILNGFETLMRKRDPQEMEGILKPLGSEGTDSPIGKILTFALCNRERIAQEIKQLRSYGDTFGWVLDLSTSAVHCLLAYWGEKFEALEVYCDDSKPLMADLTSSASIFGAMVGRKDKFYVPFGRQPSPSMVYNLSKPLSLVSSKGYAGVQIADVVASSFNRAHKNPDDELHRHWMELLEPSVCNAILPDADLLDTRKREPFVNSVLLCELADRSVKGESLLEELPEYIIGMRNIFDERVLHDLDTLPNKENSRIRG